MRPLATPAKAMCATTCCTSFGCMGLVTRCFFPAGLGAGTGGIEFSHGLGHAVPGIDWAMVDGKPLPERFSFLSQWTGAVTQTERVVVRE